MAASFPKTPCPVSRDEFKAKAQPLQVVLGGTEVDLDPREFSTKSLGWGHNGKIDVVVNGKKCVAQVGLNITLVNSKELPTT